jgi:hypothetical protein
VKQIAVLFLFASASFAQNAQERVDWVVKGTLGPSSLAGGAVSAAFGTWTDMPGEYGPHAEGFAKRFGMREAGIGTSNLMEAGLGAIWGEDPRYLRASDSVGFGGRLGRVVKLTFMAANRDGDAHPAYARYLAIAGSNALSNTWRVNSEADGSHILTRTALGFASRMAGNAFEEFWPDAKRKLFHRLVRIRCTQPPGSGVWITGGFNENKNFNRSGYWPVRLRWLCAASSGFGHRDNFSFHHSANPAKPYRTWR